MAFFAIASLLLVLGGIMKLVFPHPAAHLIGTLGLPARVWIARLIGCAELAVGAFALALGGPVVAAVVGTVYAMFALVVLRALSKGSPSCGCFGQADSPPSRVHVIANLFFVAVCLVSAGADKSPTDLVVDAARAHPAGAVSLVLAACVLAGLSFVIFTALPELIQARSGDRGGVEAFRIEPGALGRFATDY